MILEGYKPKMQFKLQAGSDLGPHVKETVLPHFPLTHFICWHVLVASPSTCEAKYEPAHRQSVKVQRQTLLTCNITG